jgi:hypothetical protein
VVSGLTGCTRTNESSPDDYVQPAVVQSASAGSVPLVTLTALAAQRLDIRTEPVARAAGAGPALVIPLTAVIYDPQGESWTYTNPQPLTFLRVAIVIDHIAGGQAYLTGGPPAGTAVVTRGAPELLGTEYGVGKE